MNFQKLKVSPLDDGKQTNHADCAAHNKKFIPKIGDRSEKSINI